MLTSRLSPALLLVLPAGQGHAAVLAALLEGQAPVQEWPTNEDFATPLHLAAEGGDLECVRLLLEAQPSPDAVNEVRLGWAGG